MSALEDRHRIALARELTAAAGVPLRDRYGFASPDEQVAAVLALVFREPDDETAGECLDLLNVTGDIELADGHDCPIDEVYAVDIVRALRPLIEQRRDAAVRGLT